MNKKADVNWFVIMAIIALVALLSMLLVSGGVFSKFFQGYGSVASDVEVKLKCTPSQGDKDLDMDGYKDGSITIDSKVYNCDPDDGNPNIYYKKGDTTTAKK